MEGTPSVALAVRRGNRETAVPRLLAMLCILAVFLPSFFMQGAAQAPVRAAVAGGRLRDDRLVPALQHVRAGAVGLAAPPPAPRRDGERGGARPSTGSATPTAGPSARVVRLPLAGRAGLPRRRGAGDRRWSGRRLGMEIFPKVDAGQFQLRLRAPTGTRIEKTEEIATPRSTPSAARSGRDNVAISVGYVGVIPSSYPINTIYQWTGGPEEAVLRVALKQGAGRRRRGAQGAAPRRSSRREMPGRAALVRAGRHRQRGHELRLADAGRGRRQRPELRRRPGLRREGPRASWPRSRRCATCSTSRRSTTRPSSVEIDRERAGLSGVTAEEVARSLVAATSSSRFVVPNYWPDPKTASATRCRSRSPPGRWTRSKQVETIPVQQPGGDRRSCSATWPRSRGHDAGRVRPLQHAAAWSA